METQQKENDLPQDNHQPGKMIIDGAKQTDQLEEFKSNPQKEGNDNETQPDPSSAPLKESESD